jgi:hypothetical protein
MTLESLLPFRRAPAKSVDTADPRLETGWSERAVTAAAVAAAVLLVVSIVLLMGSVGP